MRRVGVTGGQRTPSTVGPRRPTGSGSGSGPRSPPLEVGGQHGLAVVVALRVVDDVERPVVVDSPAAPARVGRRCDEGRRSAGRARRRDGLPGWGRPRPGRARDAPRPGRSVRTAASSMENSSVSPYCRANPAQTGPTTVRARSARRHRGGDRRSDGVVGLGASGRGTAAGRRWAPERRRAGPRRRPVDGIASLHERVGFLLLAQRRAAQARAAFRAPARGSGGMLMGRRQAPGDRGGGDAGRPAAAHDGRDRRGSRRRRRGGVAGLARDAVSRAHGRGRHVAPGQPAGHDQPRDQRTPVGAADPADDAADPPATEPLGPGRDPGAAHDFVVDLGDPVAAGRQLPVPPRGAQRDRESLAATARRSRCGRSAASGTSPGRRRRRTPARCRRPPSPSTSPDTSAIPCDQTSP